MASDNYSWILNRVSYLRSAALGIHNKFYRKDPLYTELVNRERERMKQEKLWPLKKLLILGGYTPMFLQIIFGQWKKYGRDRFYCSKLFFIDTHAGFGIDVIGYSDDEITLGSPLVALLWPQHVSRTVTSFKNLGKEFGGPYFDAYLFNDINNTKIDVLRNIVVEVTKSEGIPRNIGKDIRLFRGVDANTFLKNAIDIVNRENGGALVFIDPPGRAEAHIRFDILNELSSSIEVLDVIVIFHDGALSRAVTLNKEIVEPLLSPDAYQWLCNEIAYRNEVQKLLVEAYRKTLYDAGFGHVEVFSINYVVGSKPLYHVYVATKDRSAAWLKGFAEWYRNKRRIEGMSYEELKGYWMQVTGRATSLLRFLKTDKTEKSF